MAEISRLTRLSAGLQRQVDLSTNTLVVGDLKVGGAEGSLLTKAILDNLISLQSGSEVGGTLHTHDDRYFTETELGSKVDGAAGADLIGLTAVRNAETVQAGIEALDTDLATAEGKIDDLETLSGVASGSTDLGEFTGSTIADARTVKGALQDLETELELKAYDADVIKKDGSVDFTDDQSMGGNKLTNLAAGTDANDAVNKSQLDAVTAVVQKLEWQDSVLSAAVLDPTALTPSEGDRYLINGTGEGAWEGHDGEIAEWDGSAWSYTEPTTGMFVSADDEGNLLYQYGGSSWSAKYFESTTASTGLTKVGFDVRLADQAGSGISVSGGVISTVVDDATLEIADDALQVKANGIDDSHIRLTNAGYLKARNQDDSSDVNILRVNSSDEVEMASFFKTPSSAPQADYDVANKKYVDDQLAGKDEASEIAYDNSTSGLTATDVQAAIDEVEARVDMLEAQSTESLERPVTAGESMAAETLLAVRWADTSLSETAGRVYKADIDASENDNFYVAGLVYLGSAASAGDAITMVKLGKLSAPSHGFTVGKPVFLSDDGALTQTPPSNEDDAVVRVGMVEDANTIDVSIQVVGVN